MQSFFWNLDMKEGETVQHFVQRVKGVVKECYPKFEKSNRDALVRDRFVLGLRMDLKEVALNGRNAKLEEAVQTALMAQGVNETLGRGYAEHCYRENLREVRSTEIDRRIELKCFISNRGGHFARQCPIKKEEHVDAIIGNDQFMVDIKLHGQKTSVLVDTGATVSVIPKSKDGENGEDGWILECRTISGAPIKLVGREKCLVEYGDLKILHPFWIGEVETPVLGMDFLREHGMVVDAGRGKLWMRRKKKKWNLEMKKTQVKH